jgi:DNA-binding transcriptional LysR family regulator
MTHSISLDALQAFVVFAEELNFTKAALRMHISQPALHVKIQKLSAAMGHPLYERAGRNLRLTRHGQEVVRFGREVDELANGFLQELSTGLDNRPVVLSAGEGAYLYLLGDPIKQFTKQSRAPLRLLTRDAPATLDAVRSGLAHLGVAVLDVIPDDLEAHLLAKVPEVLAVPRGHTLSKHKVIRLAQLSKADLIVPPVDRPHRISIERALHALDVHWSVALEATGWELTLQFVQMGLGLAIVNGCCHMPPGVVAIPIPELPATSYYLIHRKRAAIKGPALALKTQLLSANRETPEKKPVRGR